MHTESDTTKNQKSKTRISKKREIMDKYNLDETYFNKIKENKKTGLWSLELSEIPSDKLFAFCNFYEKIVINDEYENYIIM
jgi:hypothetical protein